MSYEFLRKVPFLVDLPDADLEMLCEMIEEERLPAGRVLFEEGSRGDRAYVIQEGELDILKESNGREILLAVRSSGDVIGEIAILQEAPRTASVRARSDSILLAIHKEQLDHLLSISPSAARAMLHTILSRWQATEALLRQSEKMAQLGTLTAGVAHELNNPAAAVQRGAEQLDETLSRFGIASLALSQIDFTPAQQARLRELEQQASERATTPATLSPLQRSEREGELEEWLDDLGVEAAWEIAPTLVDLGYDAAELEAIGATFSSDQIAPVLSWLGAMQLVRMLLAEVGQGATRISEIVKALKGYAYLDQAPIQSVDIHKGLDATLLILRNKLKGGIMVHRDYAASLPAIQGYGSELNQVWTNLLDNAADALDGSGEIWIRTHYQEGWVVVEIEDNGPGIPPAIQDRVFDPFFTTKPPGHGTGLGLNISYQIVVHKHRGEIKLYSNPGSTCFQVWLPENFGEDAPLLAAVSRPPDSQLRRILENTRTIAVVGASEQVGRPAHSVPAYLQKKGYRIFPINPSHKTLLGERAYPTLADLPEPVDLVLIFRPADEALTHVEEAIALGAKVVWMQEGIINQHAGEVARRAGLQVVMDTCIRTTHRRLTREQSPS